MFDKFVTEVKEGRNITALNWPIVDYGFFADMFTVFAMGFKCMNLFLVNTPSKVVECIKLGYISDDLVRSVISDVNDRDMLAAVFSTIMLVTGRTGGSFSTGLREDVVEYYYKRLDK
jgi:hypothetical protein